MSMGSSRLDEAADGHMQLVDQASNIPGAQRFYSFSSFLRCVQTQGPNRRRIYNCALQTSYRTRLPLSLSPTSRPAPPPGPPTPNPPRPPGAAWDTASLAALAILILNLLTPIRHDCPDLAVLPAKPVLPLPVSLPPPAALLLSSAAARTFPPAPSASSEHPASTSVWSTHDSSG